MRGEQARRAWRATREKLGFLGIAGIFIAVGVLGIAMYDLYHPSGLGFAAYQDLYTGNKVAAKTFWDLLELLIIPMALVMIGYLINRADRQAEQQEIKHHAEIEHEIARDREREQALQTYLDRMTDLMLKENLCKSEEGSQVRQIARARTLTTLGVLDGRRKGVLVRFLREAQLIEAGGPVVRLTGADLCDAELEGAHLHHSDLGEVDLRGAFLSKAVLSNASLCGADLRDADLGGTFLGGVNLSRADLRNANLRGATLVAANLDLADLRDVMGLQQRQVDEAGTYESARLPDHILSRWQVELLEHTASATLETQPVEGDSESNATARSVDGPSSD